MDKRKKRNALIDVIFDSTETQDSIPPIVVGIPLRAWKLRPPHIKTEECLSPRRDHKLQGGNEAKSCLKMFLWKTHPDRACIPRDLPYLCYTWPR